MVKSLTSKIGSVLFMCFSLCLESCDLHKLTDDSNSGVEDTLKVIDTLHGDYDAKSFDQLHKLSDIELDILTGFAKTIDANISYGNTVTGSLKTKMDLIITVENSTKITSEVASKNAAIQLSKKFFKVMKDKEKFELLKIEFKSETNGVIGFGREISYEFPIRVEDSTIVKSNTQNL